MAVCGWTRQWTSLADSGTVRACCFEGKCGFQRSCSLVVGVSVCAHPWRTHASWGGGRRGAWHGVWLTSAAEQMLPARPEGSFSPAQELVSERRGLDALARGPSCSDAVAAPSAHAWVGRQPSSQPLEALNREP